MGVAGVAFPSPVDPAPPPRAELLGLVAQRDDVDLPTTLLELARDDQLTEFLAQTDEAVDLASSSPVFAEGLDPTLIRIRDALPSIPAQYLSQAESERVEATLGRLVGYLGPVSDTSRVPGGGLQAHEDAGGHTLERHVGKSEDWLVDRVNRENVSAASSFRDVDDAEHFIAETIAENQDRIDAWVDGQGGNRLVLDASFDASTGISVKRGDSQAEDVFSVRLVLERSDALGIGYRIITGYPSAP